jgi:hypothetical protein
MKQSYTKKDLTKPGPNTKELEVCRDCAEYGGDFCDDCLNELLKLKNETRRET